MNKRLNMTWIDLTTDSKSRKTLPIGMDIHFDIDHLDYPELLSDHILKSQPDVICFEFDYPDRDSLGLMLDAKHNHSSIPMIMVTVQHSEKLAVWAFRSRLADYLVKPIPQGDIDRCHEMLEGMALAKSGQRTRSATLTKSELPLEIPAHANISESSFSPAIYYVAHNFDKKIQNDEVANLCAMSPFRFGRGFKNTFGLSFRDYVVRYRLREACRLLNNPNTSITDAAFAAGFSDVSYFGRLFKKHFGICPSEKYSHLDNVDGENQSPTVVLELPRDLIRDFVA